MHGTCYLLEHDDSVKGVRCVCNEGYTGSRCNYGYHLYLIYLSIYIDVFIHNHIHDNSTKLLFIYYVNN